MIIYFLAEFIRGELHVSDQINRCVTYSHKSGCTAEILSHISIKYDFCIII